MMLKKFYRNVQKSIAELIKEEVADNMYSLAITNQREQWLYGIAYGQTDMQCCGMAMHAWC